MKATSAALLTVISWVATAAATPYTYEDTLIVTSPYPIAAWPYTTWPYSGPQVFKWVHYEPYSLTCQHTVQTITVPSEAPGTPPSSDVTSGVPRTITVHRC